MNYNELKSGFTLIELLVVVLIIGILSAVALPQYEKAVKKARGVQVTTAAETLVKAANLAYLEDGEYSYSRYYYSYSNLGVEGAHSAQKFDIDIPTVSVFKNGYFWLVSSGSGNTAIVYADLYLPSGSSFEQKFHLRYDLEKGALKSVTCTGAECKIYFPQYQ